MTQCEAVIDYINTQGSISPMEAIYHLGITKLATKISDLKKQGWSFKQETVKVNSRYGKTSYMRYSEAKKV